MHRLSHGDVRVSTACCWDHRSSSGGQVSAPVSSVSTLGNQKCKAFFLLYATVNLVYYDPLRATCGSMCVDSRL